MSVVIPTYNRAEFIGDAVESVLTQSYRNLEVIVVDDGSTDATEAIVAAIDDPRLCSIRQNNQGRSHARNVALGMASGDYIAFLDADDFYLPDKLALQVEYLERHPDVDMVYTTSICIDDVGNPLGHVYEAMVSGHVYAEIAFFVPVTITLPTVMLRRKVLDTVGAFDERMERFEDTDLWRRIAKRHRIGAIAEPTCKVRTHSDNALRNQDPEKIVTSIKYYINKVNREDSDVDSLVRGAGARRLCEYYARAFRGVDAFKPCGVRLLELARRSFLPKISIVIPVYNGSNYLGQAIRSALAQTYDNVEIIVVNDGSTDDGATERVARAFADRIRYVEKENGGVATALNRGIEESCGDYFSWLSHDDLYSPEKLEMQVSALAQYADPRRIVLYGDYAVFSSEPETAEPVELAHVEPENFRYFITTENVLHGCTLLVPKQAFDEHGVFNPALRTTQDYDLWFRMATTFTFVHQRGSHVQARAHAEQGTLSMSDLVRAECNTLLTGFVEQLSEDEVRRGAASYLAEGYFFVARSLEKRGYAAAGARAAELCRQSLRHVEPSEIFSLFVRESEATESLARSSEALARSSAEVESLNRQRDECLTEVQELRQSLEAVIRSQSWRVTRPLRYVKQLVGRIAR